MKNITITNDFQNIWNESDSKPTKVWVDKGSEFYNRSIISRLQDNYVEMYSTHNEGKSVVAERFVTMLKSEIQKYMIWISKKMFLLKN